MTSIFSLFSLPKLQTRGARNFLRETRETGFQEIDILRNPADDRPDFPREKKCEYRREDFWQIADEEFQPTRLPKRFASLTLDLFQPRQNLVEFGFERILRRIIHASILLEFIVIVHD